MRESLWEHSWQTLLDTFSGEEGIQCLKGDDFSCRIACCAKPISPSLELLPRSQVFFLEQVVASSKCNSFKYLKARLGLFVPKVVMTCSLCLCQQTVNFITTAEIISDLVTAIFRAQSRYSIFFPKGIKLLSCFPFPNRYPSLIPYRTLYPGWPLLVSLLVYQMLLKLSAQKTTFQTWSDHQSRSQNHKLHIILLSI